MPSLRIVLGDQLSTGISSLKDIDQDHDIVLMCEVFSEATYVKHHKKKIAFLFSAMRHFASELRGKRKYHVEYFKLDDPEPLTTFTEAIERALRVANFDKIIVTAAPPEVPQPLLDQFQEAISGIVEEKFKKSWP